MEEKYATVKELNEVKKNCEQAVKSEVTEIKKEYKELTNEVKAMRGELAAFTVAMQQRVAVIETTCSLRKEVIESLQEENKTR